MIKGYINGPPIFALRWRSVSMKKAFELNLASKSKKKKKKNDVIIELIQ